jgi:hypothetical protein
MVQFSRQAKPTEKHPTPLVSSAAHRVVIDYFGLIVRNVVGWVFILSSLTIGMTSPIPGGMPTLFLIGFVLITFPGKRHLLSRVMRGRPMKVEPWPFIIFVVAISVMVTLGGLWVLTARYEQILRRLHLQWFQVVGVVLGAAVVSWCVLRLGLAGLNLWLRKVPKLRRSIRPWLKKKGVTLLPPRRERSMPRASQPQAPPKESPIIEVHDRYHRRLNVLWGRAKPWVKRLAGVGITIWIFARILRPILRNWSNPDVQARLGQIEPTRFVTAVLMFAAFLFVFRALAWRRILIAFGFRLPVAASVRIWSTSELARYLPGAVFQVVGRVMLAKPYGVRGSITTVTQVIELTIFLLANVLVAVSCLLYFGFKNMHGPARTWLLCAFAMVPVLLLLLHPKVCYGLINRVMKRLGKPIIDQRLGGLQLLGILIWNIVGLLWQTAGMFVLTQGALGLKLAWWWVLAGPYTLAWCAGFLAFWAPGGLGVREWVFAGAMAVALPADARRHISENPVALSAVLLSISLLLRIWATAGELVLTSIVYTLDYRGGMGRPCP